ncbi:MAG: tRNA (adenosine(37)-N6)-dimethylallyltransferase MiaA [Desulfobacterales bacterium C00003060]|nr:MAG: tRNA (adenosine(37)-N6)-dimethylallyltransferase MiaA [Desulfobacterales bacterium S3730MH5]OEU78756.1 MAG: tRNA (adenosine(37)-N6)-dimethylallyltransferase MiaA [Desulfobacterales bacterium C00003060]OEU79693.1 MAG: tRNA (adenosine(37)-N6)-dimethylallyltransferase MiaA [Desulfobacterales bacterium S5133MH4]
MSQTPPLIIISGPTCVGKTDVGIALAETLGAEIISADAMQVYRYMDIGTAKITQQQRARVPHHLIDVVNPDEPFSAALFRKMADAVIRDLHQKRRHVFVVGGTGLYIKVLTGGIFREHEQDRDVRERLKKEVETFGLDALYQRLQKLDPAAAARIHPNDTCRIMRALEVHQVTGKPISYHQKAHGFRDIRYRTLKIGLTLDRDILYDHIDRRVDLMLASGLLEEVRWLLDHGYPSTLKSMQSIGYRHMADYLEGRIAWEETIRLFKRDTRRYAKRQLTWFRADPEILWAQPPEIDLMRSKVDSLLTGHCIRP